MGHFVGVDVSLELSSVCVVDTTGQVVKEAKVSTEPAELVRFVQNLGLEVERIGLEAGPLSAWLHDGLAGAGLEVVLLETRHVRAALSAMVIKTDRRDARGAQLLRMGWYRPVHRKAAPSQEVRALLVGRKLLVAKLVDVDGGIRGMLRGFGLKVGPVGRAGLPRRVRDLVEGHAVLRSILEPLLAAREAIRTELARLHGQVLALARTDEVCQRLMTAPGVGAVVALTFRSGIDDPTRFRSSRALGPYLGLTPRRYQSGETDVSGGISRAGDTMVRAALYEAATVILSRAVRFSTLKRWAMAVAARRGVKRARVALAQKLSTVLHRIWVERTTFRWAGEAHTSGRAA
ncbi:IS110 family RNA-guided transposase [Belnapia rosea]|uniref:Transposase n=1 Tax=Belnapia rosea TaxID=938405 RepID=A0A1G7DIV8_9PROT|nr:IS110 family transposase [Belnapia rosea]SDE51462.1 Transposase [Belnapia rosea]